MNKVSEAKSYQELEDFCKCKGYSLSEVNTKRWWFESNNKDGNYDVILDWLSTYLSKNNTKQKISPELAKQYKEAYGATKAVVKLKEHYGIELSRQGLYAAVNKVKGKRKIVSYYIVTQCQDILEHLYIDELSKEERLRLSNRVDWWGEQGYSCEAMDTDTYSLFNQHHLEEYLKHLHLTWDKVLAPVYITSSWESFINSAVGDNPEFLYDVENDKVTLFVDEDEVSLEEKDLPVEDIVLGLNYKDFFTRLREYGAFVFNQRTSYPLEPNEVSVSLLEVKGNYVKVSLLGYEDEFILDLAVSDIVTKHLVGTILTREDIEDKLEEGFCTDSRKYAEKWKGVLKSIDIDYYTLF